MGNAWGQKQLQFSNAMPTAEKIYSNKNKPLINGISNIGNPRQIRNKFLKGHFGSNADSKMSVVDIGDVIVENPTRNPDDIHLQMYFPQNKNSKAPELASV
jgi:hypothetical protein